MVTTIPNPTSVFNNRALFFETFLKIRDKQKRLVPLRLNRAQRHYLANRTQYDIILKARQQGFSTFIQADHFYDATTSSFNSLTLSHDDDSTQALRRLSDRFYDNLPENFRPTRKYANAGVTTYSDFDSECMISTAGSRQKGRSTTLSAVHMSEVAYYKDAEPLVAGAMQAGNPRVVMESTANGAGGFFYEHCMEALSQRGIWTLHFYAWWWDSGYQLPLELGETLTYTEDEQITIAKAKVGGFDLMPEQIKWRRFKIEQLTPRKFQQEYPEDTHSAFLASNQSFFGALAPNVFSAPLNAVPIKGRVYVAGLDFGQSNDWTVLIIIDTTTYEMVDMLRINKLDWGEMRRRVIAKAKHWNDCTVMVEMERAGMVNFEEFANEGMKVKRYPPNKKTKPRVIQTLYAGLHGGGLKLQDIAVLKHELTNFIAKQLPSGHWQYAAAQGAHDDCVLALAQAWYLTQIPTAFEFYL